MKRTRRMLEYCAVVSFVVLAASCAENLAAPAGGIAPLVPPATPRAMAAAPNDACWDDITANCWVPTNLAGAAGPASAYGGLGGYNPCFTGLSGGCGSGFGNWEAGTPGCIVSYANPSCRAVTAFRDAALTDCPTSFTFTSFNITNGNTEEWSLSLQRSVVRAGIMMGSYQGTYTSTGGTATAYAKVFCDVGFTIATAQYGLSI